MSDLQPAFDLGQTHGLLTREGLRIQASSTGSGWRSLFASTQREDPFESRCDPVRDPLVVLHLDGPVSVERLVGQHVEHSIIAPGGLHIIPGGMGFSVRLRGTLRTLHLYVRRSVLEEVAAECMPGDPAAIALLPRLGEADPMLERLLLSVRDVLQDSHPTTACYADHLARAIAARLIRRHSTAVDATVPDLGPVEGPPAAMQRAIAFMRQNLHRSIDLADIAGVTPFSPSHFARRFRHTTGQPPHRYLLQLRTERAAHLLVDTRWPIVAIAEDCGFANQEHLTRVFKRASGATPAAYRAARAS